MDIEEYLLGDLDPLTLNDKIKDVQLRYEGYTFSHLPVVDNHIYLGCISEPDIRCFDTDHTISEYQYALEGFFVRADTCWLDVLEIFAQNHTNIMPVLDEHNNYVGYYELGDIMNLFNETPFLSEPGNIVVLEKGALDYSLSEVSQIVESDSAKVLGIFISKLERDIAQITVKMGSGEINRIIQSFRRYGYNVVSSHNEDSFMDNLRKRSQYLEKYLGM